MDGRGLDFMACTFSRFDPFVYFLWGYIKDHIYGDPSGILAGLKAKIETASQGITQVTLQNFLKNMKMRLDFVIRGKGKHLEHLLS